MDITPKIGRHIKDGSKPHLELRKVGSKPFNQLQFNMWPSKTNFFAGEMCDGRVGPREFGLHCWIEGVLLFEGVCRDLQDLTRIIVIEILAGKSVNIVPDFQPELVSIAQIIQKNKTGRSCPCSGVGGFNPSPESCSFE